MHDMTCIVYMWRKEVAVQGVAPHSPPKPETGGIVWKWQSSIILVIDEGH